MKKLHMAAVGLGLAFLIALILKVGAGRLWQELGVLGWGVVPLIVSEGLANLMHAVGWRQCLAANPCRPRLTSMFGMAMAGFAINYLTPTASMGGEVTKAGLLASQQPAAEAASSVLLDKFCTAFAHVLIILFGSALVFSRTQLSPVLRTIMVVSSIVLIGGLLGFMLIQRAGKLGSVCRGLARRGLGGRKMEAAAQRISAVDGTLQTFYREHPLVLARSVAWHLLGHLMAVVQLWLFLGLMGQPLAPVNVVCASILCLWLDLLTFAVPLNLGTMEGSRMLALGQIGYPILQGMTFGAALRVAQLFWAFFGLATYGSLIWKPRRNTASAPSVDNPAGIPGQL